MSAANESEAAESKRAMVLKSMGKGRLGQTMHGWAVSSRQVFGTGPLPCSRLGVTVLKMRQRTASFILMLRLSAQELVILLAV